MRLGEKITEFKVRGRASGRVRMEKVIMKEKEILKEKLF